MRFVQYFDCHMQPEKFKKFTAECETAMREKSWLTEEDQIIFVQRPGYITEIVTLAGE